MARICNLEIVKQNKQNTYTSVYMYVHMYLHQLNIEKEKICFIYLNNLEMIC